MRINARLSIDLIIEILGYRYLISMNGFGFKDKTAFALNYDHYKAQNIYLQRSEKTTVGK